MTLTILTAMRLERQAVSVGLRAGTDADTAPQRDIRVLSSGMGPRSARRAAKLLGAGSERSGAVLVAGFAGALSAELKPGEIVLASELHGPDGTVTPCADPAVLGGVLRRAGLSVHVGPVASSARPVAGARRTTLADSGALAVDMESVWLARATGSQPPTVLRVILDTPERELHNLLGTVSGFLTARRTLRAAAALLPAWAATLADREVVLAAPRASCAGVVRAIETVERALDSRGTPIYVRKQIVHNARVVADLERRGAIFVDELDEVPDGATVIFSAHGVSPAVRAEAAERELDVIDATCPLVNKVHAEARRFASAGFEIVLVGHVGHEEVEGTFGEAPEQIRIVDSPAAVAELDFDDPERVAYLTQTTLALDETNEVVDALRDRVPALVGPASADICYATQNRQDAVRALAADCDTVLVVGSQNSSNSRRLAEVAERAGAASVLVDDSSQLPVELLAGARRVGVTAGASAPEALVQEVLSALAGLGRTAVSERTVAREDVHFKLPRESPESEFSSQRR